MATMTSRERVRLSINHKEPDRVPIRDSPWRSTMRRWHNEGLLVAANEEDLLDPDMVDYFDKLADYFDYDIRTTWTDLTPRLPVRVVSEDEEYITQTTAWGGVQRDHKDHSTTPEIVACPVSKKDDWLPLKARMQPGADRVDWDKAAADYKRWRGDNRYIAFGAVTGYDAIQAIIASEEQLTFMADDPEFIAEIAMTLARNVTATLEMMLQRGFEFDGVWTYNDMGYRNASLFSPRMYRDIIQPADRLIWDMAHRRGAQTILHSCGRVSGLIPDLLDAGLDCLQPLEVKAGMDPIALKKEFGDRLALFGGIDTRLLEQPDMALVEEEIRKTFAACMPGGGYLYHTDHSVPNDVSCERYCTVLDMVRRHGQY